MLNEISSYENLGTLNYFLQLFDILSKPGTTWSIDDIKKHFYNKLIDGRYIFDGCIPFLTMLDIIQIENDVVSISKNFEFSEISIEENLIQRVLEKVIVDDLFNEIFSDENISYDVYHRSAKIKNSAFPLKVSCFKQFLIDFNALTILSIHDPYHYLLSPKYKNLFSRFVFPQMKRNRISLEALKQSLVEKELAGEMAEQFVLSFEENRLNGKSPDWVSPFSVAEGYDIASYEKEEDEVLNRFIEVKSFSSNPGFYWSRNEIDVARTRGAQYYLYLVDSSRTSEENYHPEIIKNPYKNLLMNEDSVWGNQVENRYFYLN